MSLAMRFSTILAVVLSSTVTMAASRDDLANTVRSAQRLQIQMSNFVERYGVEVIREKNLTQKGEIEGKIDGSMAMGILGNMPALVSGIVGLPMMAGSIAVNPFSPLAMGLNPLGSILKGLSGMGYGSGSLSGSLHGQFEGTGVKINDRAHLFLIVAKRRQSFADPLNADHVLKNMRDYNADESPQLKDVMGIYNSPYIIDEALIQQFRGMRNEFRDLVQQADQLISENIGATDVIYRDAQSRVEIMKEWAADKRIAFAVSFPTPIKVDYTHTKVVCARNPDPNKYQNMLFEYGHYQDQYGNHQVHKSKNFDFCLDIADDVDWKAEIRRIVDVWQYTGLKIVGDVIEDSPIFFTVKEKKRLVKAGELVEEETIPSKYFNPNNMEISEERLFF